MQLGMIGLGRMGANLTRRLMRDGHDCVVYDVNDVADRGARRRGSRVAHVAHGLRPEARQAARGLDHGAGGFVDRIGASSSRTSSPATS